jgi:hypothetical protein
MSRNLRVVFRRWGSISLLLAALAGSTPAQAEPPRVAIMRFGGAGEVEVRIAVTKAIGARGFQLIGARAMEEAAERAGQPLDSKEGLTKAASDLKVAAVIDGRIALSRGVGTARIAVRDPFDGSVVANEIWAVGRGSPTTLARAVGKNFWKRLGPAIEEVSGYGGRSSRVARHARHRNR